MKQGNTSKMSRITVIQRPEDLKRIKDETDWEWLDKAKDEDIDTSDIPPLGKDFWRDAWLRIPIPKTAVSIRLDPKVLAWFRKQGPGYQTRIQAVLRHYVTMMVRAEAAGLARRQGKAPARVDAPEPKLSKRVAKPSAKSSVKVPASLPRKKSRVANASTR
jgi:uncharacterized protein (DUF4415 family)